MGGIELDDEEWKQIIAEVDVNGDGKVRKLFLLQSFAI